MTTSIINGICRCCSADHPLKDLTSTYNWMGEDEIYMDMLRECFDLSIRVTPNTMGGICEVCITQLRNAYNFKKQVIVTEEMFTKKLEEESYNADIKLENKEDVDLENLEDDPNFSDYDVPIKMEELIIDEDSDEKKTKKRRNAKKCSSAKKIKTESGTSKKEGSRNNMLNCHICDEQFTTIFNVKRHLRSAHKIDKKITKKTLCDSCGKVFYNEEWLGKHLARGCERRKEMICIKCDMTFDRKSDMLKHMRIRHWSENKLWKYNCPFCVESFHSHKDHDSHLFQTHDIKIYYQDMIFDSEEDLIAWKEKLEKRDGVCFLKRTSNAGKYYHCYPQEYLGNNRIPGRVKTCPARIEWKQQEELWIATYQSKHVCEKDFRKRIKKSPKVLCPRCDVMLDKFDEFYNHLAVVHRLNISVESLSFDSYDAFLNWKKTIENKNTVSFCKRSSNTTTKKGLQIHKTYYFCSRSGPSRGECKTKKSCQKTGKTCPARIILTKEENSEIFDVKYQSSHFGHDCSIDFIKLTKTERSELAERIKSGENVAQILKNSATPTVSKKVLTRRDLYNIIRDFNIDRATVNYGTKYNRTGKHSVKNYKTFEEVNEDSPMDIHLRFDDSDDCLLSKPGGEVLKET